MTLPELPLRWRQKADALRPYIPAVAQAFEEAAAELEASLETEGKVPLTVRQAAKESGYTAVHLRRLIADGTVPSEPDGTVLRCNLPRKPGHGLVAPTTDIAPDYTRQAMVRVAASKG